MVCKAMRQTKAGFKLGNISAKFCSLKHRNKTFNASGNVYSVHSVLADHKRKATCEHYLETSSYSEKREHDFAAVSEKVFDCESGYSLARKQGNKGKKKRKEKVIFHLVGINCYNQSKFLSLRQAPF